VKLAENWQIYLHSCAQTLVKDREKIRAQNVKNGYCTVIKSGHQLVSNEAVL